MNYTMYAVLEQLRAAEWSR